MGYLWWDLSDGSHRVSCPLDILQQICRIAKVTSLFLLVELLQFWALFSIVSQYCCFDVCGLVGSNLSMRIASSKCPVLLGFFFWSGCSFSLLVDLLAAWLSACCLGAHLFKWLTDAVENLLVGTFAVQTVTYHLNLRHLAKGENPKPVSFWGCPIFTIFIFLSLGTRTGRWPLWLWGEPSWQAIQGMYATHHERDPTDSH